MTIPVLMVVIYFLATIVISLVYARRQKELKTYFVAAGSMPIVMVAALLFGEIIAGAGTVGNAGTAFRIGLSSVWANWGMSIGCILFVIFVSKFFYTMGVVKGCMSVPEAYSHLFDERSRIVMMCNVAIVYFIFFSTQAPAAASIIAPLLGTNYLVTVWAFTAVFIAITIFGGIQGVAAMNILNTVVMFGGMIIVAVQSVSSLGGLTELQASVPPTFFSVAQPDFWTVFAQGAGTAIGFVASSNVATACFSANSLHTAKRGIVVAAVIVLPFALIPAVIGICASVALPGIPANMAIYLMANHLGPAFGGLISMAILAAIMDSAGILLIVTTTLTQDLFKPYIFPRASDKQQLLFSRLVAIPLAILGTWLGMNADSILSQLLGGLQIRSVVGIVLLVALAWPRVTKDAAFYSMLAGGVVAAFWHFAGNPLGIQPLWPGAGVCLLILIPMTLLSKEKISPGYQMYLDAQAQLSEMETGAPTPAQGEDE